MRVYIDASALCKAFVAELGTDEVADLLDAGESLFTSRLSVVEVASSINRLVRDGFLGASESEPILSGLATGSIGLPAPVELSPEVTARAIALLGNHLFC